MKNAEFFKTQDGSLGLYNKELNEIYHSKEGAQKESIEKFIVPSRFEDYAKNSDAVRVLDICYGIGYNSKNALSFYKHSDIIIDALEWDRELVEASFRIPFFMPEINEFLKGSIKLNNSKIIFYIEDARRTVQLLREPYDVVFLDAFAPNKLPTLWSVEFFAQLKRLMKKTSILVTYCSAQPVRCAMHLNGFYMGKILDVKNHSMATVASLNPKLIETPLDDYDLGLMNTKAGIPYRDAELNGTPEEIFQARNEELEESKLQGASAFIKNHSSI